MAWRRRTGNGERWLTTTAGSRRCGARCWPILPPTAIRTSARADSPAVLQALAAPDRPPALPRRVVVFGISALPQQALAALAALGRHCQVILAVHNPCTSITGAVWTTRNHRPPPGSARRWRAAQPRQPVRRQPAAAGRLEPAWPGFWRCWTSRPTRALSAQLASQGQRIDLFTRPDASPAAGSAATRHF